MRLHRRQSGPAGAQLISMVSVNPLCRPRDYSRCELPAPRCRISVTAIRHFNLTARRAIRSPSRERRPIRHPRRPDRSARLLPSSRFRPTCRLPPDPDTSGPATNMRLFTINSEKRNDGVFFAARLPAARGESTSHLVGEIDLHLPGPIVDDHLHAPRYVCVIGGAAEDNPVGGDKISLRHFGHGLQHHLDSGTSPAAAATVFAIFSVFPDNES